MQHAQTSHQTAKVRSAQGQWPAAVKVGRKLHYLGTWNSPERKVRYQAVIAEWAATQDCAPAASIAENLPEADTTITHPRHVGHLLSFESGANMAHVRQAFNRVKAGGRLVAIMSNGFRIRQTSRATGFHAWLEEMDADAVDLPDDAFTPKAMTLQAEIRKRRQSVSDLKRQVEQLSALAGEDKKAGIRVTDQQADAPPPSESVQAVPPVQQIIRQIKTVLIEVPLCNNPLPAEPTDAVTAGTGVERGIRLVRRCYISVSNADALTAHHVAAGSSESRYPVEA